MSAITCTFCGGTMAPGVLHDPKQCAPERGLDFEKAKLEAVLEYYGDGKPLSWDTDKYEAALNAQVAERIAEARREEREHIEAILERWGWTPQTCPQGHVGCFLPPGHDHPVSGPHTSEAR